MLRVGKWAFCCSHVGVMLNLWAAHKLPLDGNPQASGDHAFYGPSKSNKSGFTSASRNTTKQGICTPVPNL